MEKIQLVEKRVAALQKAYDDLEDIQLTDLQWRESRDAKKRLKLIIEELHFSIISAHTQYDRENGLQ